MHPLAAEIKNQISICKEKEKRTYILFLRIIYIAEITPAAMTNSNPGVLFALVVTGVVVTGLTPEVVAAGAVSPFTPDIANGENEVVPAS